LREGSDTINLGVGFEISIRDLTALMAELTGFRAKTLSPRDSPPSTGTCRRRVRAAI
jgi:hypothetical protein